MHYQLSYKQCSINYALQIMSSKLCPIIYVLKTMNYVLLTVNYNNAISF